MRTGWCTIKWSVSFSLTFLHNLRFQKTTVGVNICRKNTLCTDTFQQHGKVGAQWSCRTNDCFLEIFTMYYNFQKFRIIILFWNASFIQSFNPFQCTAYNIIIVYTFQCYKTCFDNWWPNIISKPVKWLRVWWQHIKTSTNG